MNSVRERQEKLASYYHLIMGDPAKLVKARAMIHDQRREVEIIENDWNCYEESLLDKSDLPDSKSEFLVWYLACEKKINEDIRFFIDYMRHEATVEQVAYYICMEEMVDGAFDDLMAIAQIGMPMRCKMVAAENYWDEMGNGDFCLVHTTMFKTSSSYMRKLIAGKIELELPPVECLMNGNILLMWAARREFNVRLIGAMGLVEGSAPVRFGATTTAMERLNLPHEVIAYHKAHIGIDTRHSTAWFEHVLEHYSGGGKDVIRELAVGVMVRYNIAIRYYKHMYSSMRSVI